MRAAHDKLEVQLLGLRPELPISTEGHPVGSRGPLPMNLPASPYLKSYWENDRIQNRRTPASHTKIMASVLLVFQSHPEQRERRKPATELASLSARQHHPERHYWNSFR